MIMIIIIMIIIMIMIRYNDNTNDMHNDNEHINNDNNNDDNTNNNIDDNNNNNNDNNNNNNNNNNIAHAAHDASGSVASRGFSSVDSVTARITTQGLRSPPHSCARMSRAACFGAAREAGPLPRADRPRQ